MDSPNFKTGKLTPEEEVYLRENFRTVSYPVIAQHLSRDPDRLANMAWHLGLKRTPEEQKAIILKFSQSLFKPGHRPAAADKYKGHHFSPATEFKKGRLPHNTLHDNAITIRTDRRGVQYKWIRLSLGVWKQLHLHKWETEVGPVPPGHVVAFKTKDTLLVELHNLHCVPRGTQQTGRPRSNQARKVKDITSEWMARNGKAQAALSVTTSPAPTASANPRVKLSMEARAERVIATVKAKQEAKRHRATEKQAARDMARKQKAAEAAIRAEEKAAQARSAKEQAAALKAQLKVEAKELAQAERLRKQAEQHQLQAQSQQMPAAETPKARINKPKKVITKVLESGQKEMVNDIETRRLIKKITTSRKVHKEKKPKQERKSLVEKLKAMSYKERMNYFQQKTKGLVPVWLDAKTCVYRDPSKL